jgi:Zn-dependent protease
MLERFEWSAGIGRWLGVSVRIHATLLLFLILIFAVGWHYQDRDYAIGTGTVTAAMLLLAVLLHELAHLFAIKNLGGEIHSVTLTPWGGKSSFSLPALNRDRLLVHLAGPAISFCLFLVGALVLTQSSQSNWQELMNPLLPRQFQLAEWQTSTLEIFTWLNFQIFLVNLLPCFPFDGVQIARTLFLMVGNELSRLKIESTLLAIGQLTAASFFVLAWLTHKLNHGPIQPTWALMLTACVTLMFCARYDYQRNLADALEDDDWMEAEELDEEEAALDYEANQFGFFAEDSYSQWLVEKQQQRDRVISRPDESELAEDDDRRSDHILRKLHDQGMDSLTDDERSVLQRVSERLRKQREQGV